MTTRPDSWKRASFGNVAQIITGSTPPKDRPEYYGGAIPFLTPAELQDGLISEPSVYLSAEGANVAKILPVASVLVTCIGTLGKVGYCHAEAATNQQVNALVFDPAKIWPRYGYHYCRTLKPRLESMAPATTIPIVNKRRFSELTIPFPDIPEQRRIATILDKADCIRRKRENGIRLTGELLRSTFLEMFGNSGMNAISLPCLSMDKVFHITTGKLDANAAVGNGEYPFFTCSRETSAIDHFAFDTEALILSGNNASADYSVKYYAGKFNAYQRTYVLTLQNTSHSYQFFKQQLEYKLREMKLGSKGTNTKYLTLDFFRRLPLTVPSIEAQATFQRLAERAHSLRKQRERALSESKGLFYALSQRAFRGDL